MSDAVAYVVAGLVIVAIALPLAAFLLAGLGLIAVFILVWALGLKIAVHNKKTGERGYYQWFKYTKTKWFV